MEAEVVTATPAMKEAINCADMMGELGFEDASTSMPIYIDNSSALHVAGNNTYGSCAIAWL